MKICFKILVYNLRFVVCLAKFFKKSISNFFLVLTKILSYCRCPDTSELEHKLVAENFLAGSET